ncbi:MAG: hypothetical protein NVS4B2_16000 [Chloroflexota bacterium]
MEHEPACRAGRHGRARPGRWLIGAVRLIHPFPVALVVVTSEVLLLVAHHGSPGASTLWRSGSVVLLSQIAVGALNDRRDWRLDAIAQPRKPIPSGLIEPRHATAIVIASLLALVPFAATFGPIAFCLTALGTAAGLAYDVWLKPTRFSIAGYIVGFLALITWIWVVAGHITGAFLAVYPVGTFLLLSAHLAQSFPDIESDRRTGQHGLASRLGMRMTYWSILVPLLISAPGGFVLSLVLGSPWGMALNAVALALAGGGLSLHERVLHDLHARLILFRLTAPAIAAIVFGTLATLTGLR